MKWGVLIAAIVSYAHNHSILWAIFHGFLSWWFVAYAIFAY